MSQSTGISEKPRIECAASADFADWLRQSGGSLAVSTYQAGKVAMLGHDGRQVTLLTRQFDKPLGMGVHGELIALATREDLIESKKVTDRARDRKHARSLRKPRKGK